MFAPWSQIQRIALAIHKYLLLAVIAKTVFELYGEVGFYEFLTRFVTDVEDGGGWCEGEYAAGGGGPDEVDDAGGRRGMGPYLEAEFGGEVGEGGEGGRRG
jgi:hypothetical protein